MKIIEISIVIPVYNSSQILDELYNSIFQTLSLKFEYEVVFVNDCSIDNSWIKILNLVKNHKNIIGINLRKNSGQDNSILAGLRMAKGNYVVIMDDDLQHQPNDILALYNECTKGFDVCYANFSRKRQSVIKNIGSILNGKIAQFLINKPPHLYLSPFKIINHSTVNEIGRFLGPFPYIDGIILSVTQNIKQIDLIHQARKIGRSNYSFLKSFSVFVKMFTGFSVTPLRIASFVGILSTVIGFFLITKYLYDYFISKNFIEGWTTVVVLLIFFGGLILLTLGVIGEYIGRIYLTLNNKPQYSISEIVKSDAND